MATINYVKFQRGTTQAYEALKTAGKLDNNSLYFIYDADNADDGRLYIGSRAIGGGINGEITLDSLSDVIVAEAKANSFLVKDANGNWQAKSLQEVVELIENNSDFVPQADNKSAEIVDGKVQLKNFNKGYYKYVPAVKNDSGAITEPSSYTYVEGAFVAGLEPRVIEKGGVLEIAWYEPSTETAEGVNAKVDSLTKSLEDTKEALNEKANAKDVYTKAQTETAIKTAIDNADHLRRIIVASKEEINVNAENAGSFIYMVPSKDAAEGDKYDEYVVIEGKLEKVGSWSVDLNDYAKKDELSQLQEIIDDNQKELTEKLQAIEDKANKAILTANTDNFKVTEGHLTLVTVKADQISGDISSLQYIKSVADDFNVSEQGQLSLVKVSAAALVPVLGDITLLNGYSDGVTMVARINELDGRLTWQEM